MPVALAIVFLLLSSCSPEEKFTREKWDSYSWNDRQLLISNFLDKNEIVGLNRDDIIALLGNETSSDPNFDGYPLRFDTLENLCYDFGEVKNRKGYNICLVINFDYKGFVSDYKLETYQQ